MNRSQGFTLLEVLIALLVLGIALAALVRTGQVSAETVTQLEQRSAAYHVADQALMGLYQANGLTTGRHQGEQLFNDQRWYWLADVENTENPRIAKITLKVGDDNKVSHALAQLVGFKSL
ncbi:type II secretion system minor pseudopilin GspI [Marinicella rhabdoformis]|uniref:type II secretion system minor pseudopilin GspI n=1 Tax=Marinicella rhabdoformis TaxID=2580566 RepID=UPI0012AEDE3F|nr:type II secretion system minor pseudopilin GspI [Marinicella rhabdoformis]